MIPEVKGEILVADNEEDVVCILSEGVRGSSRVGLRQPFSVDLATSNVTCDFLTCEGVLHASTAGKSIPTSLPVASLLMRQTCPEL